MNTNDSGTGSLRQAIIDASDGDTIRLPAGLYNLGSVLSVSKSLTFIGAGARTTIIDGPGNTQLFSFSSTAAAASVQGMTLRNGLVTNSNGGAIVSSVPLALLDDAILGNTVTGTGNGGGVYAAAQLTMERDLVAGNTAPGE